jgi:hypothetical protein
VAFLSVPKNARDVGQCIYCDATEEPLGKEHAVPYGLNGPWTLLRASCRICADITHRFERDSLRGLFPAFAPSSECKLGDPANDQGPFLSCWNQGESNEPFKFHRATFRCIFQRLVCPSLGRLPATP